MLRIRKQKSGQSVVEFALAIPLFLMLVMAIIDVSRYVVIESSMSHIVRSSLRYGVTGLSEEDPDNPGSELSWSDSLIVIAEENNHFDGWIDIQKTTDSFHIYLTDSAGSSFPEKFPRGNKVTIEFTQQFESLIPYADFLLGGNDGMQIKVKTTYQMEK